MTDKQALLREIDAHYKRGQVPVKDDTESILWFSDGNQLLMRCREALSAQPAEPKQAICPFCGAKPEQQHDPNCGLAAPPAAEPKRRPGNPLPNGWDNCPLCNYPFVDCHCGKPVAEPKRQEPDATPAEAVVAARSGVTAGETAISGEDEQVERALKLDWRLLTANEFRDVLKLLESQARQIATLNADRDRAVEALRWYVNAEDRATLYDETIDLSVLSRMAHEVLAASQPSMPDQTADSPPVTGDKT